MAIVLIFLWYKQRLLLSIDAQGLNIWFTIKSWLKTVHGGQYHLINSYGISVSKMTTYVSRLSWWQPHSTFPFYELLPRVICLVQSEAETAYTCEATEFEPSL